MTSPLLPWEDALWAAAEDVLGPEPLRQAVLAPAILARSERYTTRRDALGEHLRGAAATRDLAARALFFGVADLGKVAIPVDELARSGRLPARDPLRVLDLGAGAGAMTLGLAAATSRALDVVAIDRDAGALELLAAAARRAPSPITVRTIAGDLAARGEAWSASPGEGRHPLSDAAHDLILLGTVVNELPVAARAPLILDLVQRVLAPGGAVIILEPALRETTRALHELRDAVAAAGVFVAAPCTRQGPCPALADPKDWCHEDRRAEPPPRLAALARVTGLRQHGLKFSYLTLLGAADATPLAIAPPGSRRLRVVSDALDQKGTIERFVCGDDGRRRVRVLKRERTPSREALDASSRGDVLVEDADGAFTRA